MRTRYLKPGFFENEELSRLPISYRLVYAGLWLLADREGRLRDRPAQIKGELFPYDNTNVARALSGLADAGFIRRYEIDGKRLIWIPTFSRHQRPHPHEPASTLPRHPDDQSNGDVMTMSGSDPPLVMSTSNENVNENVDEYELPPANPFAFAYASKYREHHEGKPIPQSVHGVALALEKEYGADLCIEVATEKGWDKHPNYYRDALKERRDSPKPEKVKSLRFTG